MDPNTPARKKKHYDFVKKGKQLVDQLKVIWLSIIKRILMSNKLRIDFRDEKEIRQLETLYNDRNRWINLVRNMKLKCTYNVDDHDVTDKTLEKLKKSVGTEIF